MTHEQIKEKMAEIMAAGDEKALERFVIEHFKELPEDLQGKVLLSFYSESLQKQADEARIAQLQEDGVATLKALSEMKDAEDTK